jgi:hypothetical protein
MRRLKNGWEIAGAVSICIALASVFVYLCYLIGWYSAPTTDDVIVAVILIALSLFVLIWSPPDDTTRT